MSIAKQEILHVKARNIPVPKAEVSPEMQALIKAAYQPIFDRHPKSVSEWKDLAAEEAKEALSNLLVWKEKMKVKVTPDSIGGVKVYWIEPHEILKKNKNRLLVHLHGGGYVLGGGESGVGEAVLMAVFGGFKILSIDYRMPPDDPYPAPLDDALNVWKEIVKRVNPQNIGLFGASTGGGMTLALVLRARDEKLPHPGAIAPGTPWADLTDTGDSYKTNEWIDNVLVTPSGWLSDAAKLYAAGHDLKEPYLSPIYGDFHGFPPAILTAGTRDLFLSNTIRTHRKLRRAGVLAELNVYEGQSHAQYLSDPDAPETKEALTEIALFFEKHLGN